MRAVYDGGKVAMPTQNSYKIRTRKRNLFLRVSRGHFATSHSHINYYIDVTTHKTRLSEAEAVAHELVSYYNHNTVIDTILCLDGTEVIGTCLAKELERGNFANLNKHETVYVVTPEHTTGSQLLFRDNIASMMIKNKNVLILAASVTTGYTASSAVEAVKYYGGNTVGICSIFATLKECAGFTVHSIFDPADLDDYSTYSAAECPMCKAGQRIDALVNSYGYSKI